MDPDGWEKRSPRLVIGSLFKERITVLPIDLCCDLKIGVGFGQ
jgi:hypothetical protein